MISVLSRAIAAVRVWLGLNDPVEDRLHAPHGWLLPSAADARAHALGRTLALASAAPARGKRA
jgi:hypothetical protein